MAVPEDAAAATLESSVGEDRSRSWRSWRSWEDAESATDKPVPEPNPLHQLRTNDAATIRGKLVDIWRDLCKPRKQGTIAPQPRGCKVDFDPLFQQWLAARGLEDSLERVENQRGWFVYKYKREPVVQPEEWWDQAFHGTWWYPVWSMLESGVLLESDDRALGHDFWEPGVYCSPKLETGRWYARPQVLFADGCYHRVVFELRVDPERRKKNRQRGGIQWVFNSDAVSIYGLWVQVNAPPVKGEERLNDWDPALEALPLGQVIPPEVKNTREGPWPEPEEPDDDTEDWSAPHLHETSPKADGSKSEVGWAKWSATEAKDKSSIGWAPPWMANGGQQWSSGKTYDESMPPWMKMLQSTMQGLLGTKDSGSGNWGKDSKWTKGKNDKWKDKDDKWQQKKQNGWGSDGWKKDNNGWSKDKNGWNKDKNDKVTKASATSSSKAFKIGDMVQFKYEEEWENGVVTSIDPEVLVRFEILPDMEGLAYSEIRHHPQAGEENGKAEAGDVENKENGSKIHWQSGFHVKNGFVPPLATAIKPQVTPVTIVPAVGIPAPRTIAPPKRKTGEVQDSCTVEPEEKRPRIVDE